MVNKVLETIQSRSSIRAYQSKPLTKEQIQILTDAALASPSSMNRQPYQFIVVKNKALIQEWEQAAVDYFTEIGDSATRERLKSRNNKVFYNAPCVIVVAIENKGTYPLIDAGIAVQNIALAAKSIGLDSVILGLPSVVFAGENAAMWRKRLKLSEDHKYGIGIAVGYAAMEKFPHKPDPSKVSTIE